MNNQNAEQLLAEVENLLRTMPALASIRSGAKENYSWLGRACAVIERWNAAKGIMFSAYATRLNGPTLGVDPEPFYRNMLTMMHQARADLQFQTVGPLTIAVAQGSYFDYFDELRKVIETAKTDLLFVDPYLDGEFVARYLPNVTTGVKVRLLSSEKIASLLPAVEAFSKQDATQIVVRTSPNLHDRYLLVDANCCYQSGASFKDGAKNAPTTLTQITDAFTAVQSIYENLWANGMPRP